MGRYRYRTSVLLGPWRDGREQAIEDAISNKQARRADTEDGILWLVLGEIEDEEPS